MTAKSSSSPRVFISYAHENAGFINSIKELADWLSSNGLTVVTDHQHKDRPPEVGWQVWMQDEIENADVVLVICSPSYKKRFAKREKPGTGKGATFEGAIIIQDLYDASLLNKKFFPVLPDNGSIDDIPKVLQPFNCNHRFPSGNDRILKLIRGDSTSSDPNETPAEPPGLLTGPHDNRIIPREGCVLGREEQISKVVKSLDSIPNSSFRAIHVTGTAGVGKTEVCNAALSVWLSGNPETPAFYILKKREFLSRFREEITYPCQRAYFNRNSFCVSTCPS